MQVRHVQVAGAGRAFGVFGRVGPFGGRGESAWTVRRSHMGQIMQDRGSLTALPSPSTYVAANKDVRKHPNSNEAWRSTGWRSRRGKVSA